MGVMGAALMGRFWKRVWTWIRVTFDGPHDIIGYYPARVPYEVIISTEDGMMHKKSFETDRIHDTRHISMMLGRIYFTSAKARAIHYAFDVRKNGFESQHHVVHRHYPTQRIIKIEVVPTDGEENKVE